jgi:predicted transcriptional regulator
VSDECYAFILLSDEKWWKRLCESNRGNGKAQIFVRRNRVGPVSAEKLLFYVKRPLMQIRGVADFVERLSGNYKELWGLHGDETCLKDFKEYINFLGGRENVTFIRFKNLRELETPIPIDVIRRVLGIQKIPRNGKYINRETANQLIT